jgi:dihydroorotate dehydrogenase
MGLYRALVRPAVFALPSESGHRVAEWALRLPLGWDRVGGTHRGAGSPTTLAGIELSNPVGLAAGFDKGCRELANLGRLGFGYTIGGTVTRRPREGNPRPRMVRRVPRRSLVNAMGLPNPGAKDVARRLAGTEPTTARFISIADEELEDVLHVHALIEPHVRATELNVSCPNVSWGRDRDAEEHLRRLLRELVARKARPLFVKLPPFRTPREREAVLVLAGLAQEFGADGLTCSNSLLVEESRLAVGRGGLTGGELTTDTPRIVAEVHRSTGGAFPINACGGIASPEDAAACLEAGATTVQLYTALVYEGPGVVARIAKGLPARVPAERPGRLVEPA